MTEEERLAEKKWVLDTIKEETKNCDPVLKENKLDGIEEHLNDRAHKLYTTKVYSTVHEYNLVDGKIMPVDPKHLDNIMRAMAEKVPYDPYPGQKVDRKVSLVRFAGKMVRSRTGEFPERAIKRWAKVLNKIADKGIWEFGTLGAFWIPLGLNADGGELTPTQALMARVELTALTWGRPHDGQKNKVSKFEKNLQKTKELADTIEAPFDQRVKEQGRSFIIMTYVGIAPKYDTLYDDKHNDITNKRLNELLHNEVFLEEGACPTLDWSNLPE